MRTATLAAALAVCGSGCAFEEEESGSRTALLVSPIAGELESDFAEVAASVQEFAGYYYDENGRLIVLLTDTFREHDVLVMLKERPVFTLGFGDRWRDGTKRPVLEPETRVADYTFTELANWRAMIGPVLDIEGVVSLDLDEVRNRIVIEVADSDSDSAVRDFLGDFDLPPDVVMITLGAFPEAQTHTLSSLVRPVKAGLKWVNAATGTGCSIGLNIRDTVGNNGFLSASHCSPTMFGVDLSEMHQPTLSNLVGHETQDPLGWDCDGGGSGTRICRFSDAAFWVRASGVTSSFARIARTTGWTGSKIIDHSNSQFTVTGERATTVGLPVDRMGYAGGWSAGTVTGSCIDFNGTVPSGDVRIVCAGRANYSSFNGDSGGPVFWWDYPTGNVQAVGIHFGFVGSDKYFSTMANIREDFGNIDTY